MHALGHRGRHSSYALTSCFGCSVHTRYRVVLKQMPEAQSAVGIPSIHGHRRQEKEKRIFNFIHTRGTMAEEKIGWLRRVVEHRPCRAKAACECPVPFRNRQRPGFLLAE